MKNLNTITIYVVGLLLFALTSCIEDECEQTVTYTAYEPVYMSYSEFRSAIRTEDARDLKNPGKIYFKDDYIFINEINKGIHIIHNIDPSNPRPVSFINIPGNHDVAGKGEILYADSQMDLVVFDISDPANPVLVNRKEDVFPMQTWFNGFSADPGRGVVTDWLEQEVTETVSCDDWNGGIMPWFRGGVQFDMLNQSGGVPTAGPESNAGVGGSMARFTLKDDFLLTINEQQLFVFDVENLRDPNKVGESYIGWEIETIFPYGDHIFIGSRTGMYIYEVSDPVNPEFISMFSHARRCDPVVVEGNYAYVTLRSGNEMCDGFSNELNVVDISTLSRPTLVKSYEMHNPHGLGIREGTLFICDGDDGLKVYDADDVEQIDRNQIAHFGEIHAFDVIPLHNLLLMIGDDGFYQYDYSDLENIRLLGRIPVMKE